MTGASNSDIERAEARAEQERDASIARVRATLAAEGATHCRDCGDEIDAFRRKVLPSATRCVDCANRAEVESHNGRRR